MDFVHHMLRRGLLERAPVPELRTINGVVMSVVYVTERPTFTGVIGGLTTLGPDSDSTSTRPTSPSQSTQLSSAQSRASVTARISSLLTSTSSANVPATAAPTSFASVTYGQDPSTQTAGFGDSDSSRASAPSGLGMSLGGKIGLAIGILCGIGVVLSLILLCLARKRRQMNREVQDEDEKQSPGLQSPTPVQNAVQQNPIAPRLSLRPVSRLVPEFIGGQQQRNRTSQGNMLVPMGESKVNYGRNASPAHELVERVKPTGDRSKPAENPFQDPENPFVDPERASRAPPPTGPSPVNPMAPPAVHPNSMARNGEVTDPRMSGPTAESFPIPYTQGPSTVAAPPPAARAGPIPAPISIPPAAALYELPAAPSPVVAPGPGPGPESPPKGNVYRIMMDFRPTMDDELELRSGQLVRMLHEYDDGWALCIRLDRSQQGVVPRTCLAAKPSKPRPGLSGAGSRPITPQGRLGGSISGQVITGPPYNPAPVRAQSPAIINENTGAYNQSPRPLSPGPRPQPSLPAQLQIQTPATFTGPQGSGGAPTAPVDHRDPPPAPGTLGPATTTARSASPGLAM